MKEAYCHCWDRCPCDTIHEENLNIITALQARLKKAKSVMCEHECPGDGSIDQQCFVRVHNGQGCSITEFLEGDRGGVG